MLDIDWRSPAAYQHAKNIPASGFAWEYLRRDDDYHRDFERVNRRKSPAATTLETFSQRWGLRFPTQSVGAGRSRVDILDSELAAGSRAVVHHDARTRVRSYVGRPDASSRSRSAACRRWLAWSVARGRNRPSILAYREAAGRRRCLYPDFAARRLVRIARACGEAIVARSSRPVSGPPLSGDARSAQGIAFSDIARARRAPVRRELPDHRRSAPWLSWHQDRLGRRSAQKQSAPSCGIGPAHDAGRLPDAAAAL